jgi:hypothetical protein
VKRRILAVMMVLLGGMQIDLTKGLMVVVIFGGSRGRN